MTEKEKRMVKFAHQGLKTQTIEIAPEAEDPESKRIEIIQEEDQQLDKNLFVLDVGTKERNRTFQERLDEVWEMTRGWEAKLKTESMEAFETITQMRETYNKHISDYKTSFLAEINSKFDQIDNEYYVSQVERSNRIEVDMEHFFQIIVPQEADRQLVEIQRKAKKARETFEIEVQKTKKSHMKFVQRASRYIHNTAQHFTDEDALMSSCFFNLEDEVVELERRAVRKHLRDLSHAIDEHMSMTAKLKKEAEEREREDVSVLNTVVDSQRLLQETVILHFGSDDDLIL